MRTRKSPDKNLFFSKTWPFLNEFLIGQSGRSPATVESYRDSLTIFKNYLVRELGRSIADFQFSDCTKECIYNFREQLLRTGSQPSTINVRVAAIRSYLKYVADTDISVQSVAQALSAILAAPPCTKTGVRGRAILVLLYDTAARISELLGIRLCDIALDTPYPSIFITGKGNKERTIQLSEQSSSHLREYIRVFHRASAKDDYLFFTTIKGVTGRMSPGNVQRLIKKYAAQARNLGLDIPQSVHPHMFRRTRATNLYQEGVAIELVSTVLGHARTDTTRNYYAKPSVEQLRKALESVPTPASDEEPLWVDSEEEMARLCGLR